jgi:hypothetical protein
LGVRVGGAWGLSGRISRRVRRREERLHDVDDILCARDGA